MLILMQICHVCMCLLFFKSFHNLSATLIAIPWTQHGRRARLHALLIWEEKSRAGSKMWTEVKNKSGANSSKVSSREGQRLFLNRTFSCFGWVCKLGALRLFTSSGWFAIHLSSSSPEARRTSAWTSGVFSSLACFSYVLLLLVDVPLYLLITGLPGWCLLGFSFALWNGKY